MTTKSLESKVQALASSLFMFAIVIVASAVALQTY